MLGSEASPAWNCSDVIQPRTKHSVLRKKKVQATLSKIHAAGRGHFFRMTLRLRAHFSAMREHN